jgi:hypothetical protein
MKFLVIYLKACSTVTMQLAGGQVIKDQSIFGARVSRSNSDFPRIIPASHRKILLSNPEFLRLWLSLFGVYRVLDFKGTLKTGTITDPSRYSTAICEPLLSRAVSELLSLSRVTSVPRERDLLAIPVPISKSAPASRYAQDSDVDIEEYQSSSTSLLSLVHSAKDLKQSSTWVDFVGWCKFTSNRWLVDVIELLSVYQSGSYRASPIGKIGMKAEPAGKIRLFAMVDPFTQWVLRPLHLFLFKVLKGLRTDGTFNQLAPLHRLVKNRRIDGLWSVDLSAATDRLPISLQKAIIRELFTERLSILWESLLVKRVYSLFQPMKPRLDLRYSVGQPMGALSSWAMLALTHHAIVKIASYKAGYRRGFDLYAILGDDITIGKYSVYMWYRRIMNSLCVSISDHKSLLSDSGTGCEFAKRLLYKGKDASPISFREILGSLTDNNVAMELVTKHKVPFKGFLRLVGFGYKARALAITNPKLQSLPKRLRHYTILYWLRKSDTSIIKVLSRLAPIDRAKVLQSELALLDQKWEAMDKFLYSPTYKDWGFSPESLVKNVRRFRDTYYKIYSSEFVQTIVSHLDSIAEAAREVLSQVVTTLDNFSIARIIFRLVYQPVRSENKAALEQAAGIISYLKDPSLDLSEDSTWLDILERLDEAYDSIDKMASTSFQVRSVVSSQLSLHDMKVIRDYKRLLRLSGPSGIRINNLIQTCSNSSSLPIDIR